MSAVMAKTCKNCGRSFLTREKDKLFCEIRCEDFFKDGINVLYNPESGSVSFLNTNRKCKNCGKILEQRGKEYKSRKFCSARCATAYKRKTKKGKTANCSARCATAYRRNKKKRETLCGK